MALKTCILAIKFFCSLIIEQFKTTNEETAVRQALPAVGLRYVAGIESVRLDGRIFYYGYSYSSDIVVSPLFSCPHKMAAYAAKYLAQTDGKHRKSYWDTLVQDANTSSGIFGDIPNVSSHEYATLIDNLEHAIVHGELKRELRAHSQIIPKK